MVRFWASAQWGHAPWSPSPRMWCHKTDPGKVSSGTQTGKPMQWCIKSTFLGIPFSKRELRRTSQFIRRRRRCGTCFCVSDPSVTSPLHGGFGNANNSIHSRFVCMYGMSAVQQGFCRQRDILRLLVSVFFESFLLRICNCRTTARINYEVPKAKRTSLQ